MSERALTPGEIALAKRVFKDSRPAHACLRDEFYESEFPPI